MSIERWLAPVHEMPEEGADPGQNWAGTPDVPGIVPPPTPLLPRPTRSLSVSDFVVFRVFQRVDHTPSSGMAV